MNSIDPKFSYNNYAHNEIYTDIQSLKNMKYESKRDPKHATKEVAKQFESILLQMVLHSMRDANKAFSSDLFGTDQMEFYQDIFDKQLSLVMSNSGIGFASMIEKNIAQQNGQIPERGQGSDDKPVVQASPMIDEEVVSNQSIAAPLPQKNFSNPEEFVKSLWTYAKNAASYLGVSPEILIAQAALETNWGKNILPQGKNNSSFNLFNIKSDNNWNKKVTVVSSLEERNGVVVKEKSGFRCYDSYQDCFSDYISFIKNNSRYHDALEKASDPEQYINALQKAGFATDHLYADKILKIFSSDNFKNMVKRVEVSSEKGVQNKGSDPYFAL